MNKKYKKSKKKNIKKKSKPINKIVKNTNKYLPEIMEKRFNIIIIILVIAFAIIGGRLFTFKF